MTLSPEIRLKLQAEKEKTPVQAVFSDTREIFDLVKSIPPIPDFTRWETKEERHDGENFVSNIKALYVYLTSEEAKEIAPHLPDGEPYFARILKCEQTPKPGYVWSLQNTGDTVDLVTEYNGEEIDRRPSVLDKGQHREEITKVIYVPGKVVNLVTK